MARLPDLEVTVRLNTDPLRDSLSDILEALHFDGAAAALYAAPGVVTIPRGMADTRDGREEATQLFAEAMLDNRVGTIVIQGDHRTRPTFLDADDGELPPQPPQRPYKDRDFA